MKSNIPIVVIIAIPYVILLVNGIIQWRRRASRPEHISKWRVVKGGRFTKKVVLDDFEKEIS